MKNMYLFNNLNFKRFLTSLTLFTFLFGFNIEAKSQNVTIQPFSLSVRKDNLFKPNPYKLEKLAYSNYKNNQIELAQKQALQVLEHEGRHFYANFVLGSIELQKYYKKKDEDVLQKAVSYLKKSLEIIPNNTEALMSLTKCYLEQKETEKAYRALRALDEIKANDVEINNMLGQVYTQKAEYIYAEKCLSKSLKLKPTSETYFRLGILYEKLGDVDKAIKHYTKVKRNDPNHDEVRDNIERLILLN